MPTIVYTASLFPACMLRDASDLGFGNIFVRFHMFRFSFPISLIHLVSQFHSVPVWLELMAICQRQTIKFLFQ